MESTVKKYAKRIAGKKVSAHIPYDGRKNGMIVDPSDRAVPVDFIGFGAYQLSDGPFELESRNREMVFLPMEGRFHLSTGNQSFSGSRVGGIFAHLPRKSNATAVYVPPESRIRLEGEGELVFFYAPASGGRPPVQVSTEEGTMLRSGAGLWRRDVLMLVSPDRVSKNLTVGETYSPPGHWSGTPLHVHDKNDPDHDQSDHEEIYYHRFRLQSRDPFGPYAVQLLFDGITLDESYIIRDRSVIAIPGVSHPVVSGPVSDHVYTFGLGGIDGSPMMMFDMPEFSYLKTIGNVLSELETRRGATEIPRKQLESFKGLDVFTEYQTKLLELILKERGFTIV